MADNDTVYGTRGEALAAAVDGEARITGTSVYRLGDGWGVSYSEAHDTETCELLYRDGRVELSEAYFQPSDPDAWWAVDTVKPGDWRHLAPVRDFLDGDADEVHVFTLAPGGVSFDKDGNEHREDASKWIVLCAVRYLAPDWHDGLGRDIILGVNAMLREHDVDAWPAPGGGASIGVDGRVQATVRRDGDQCAVTGADGTTVRVPADDGDKVAKAVGDTLANAQ